MRRSGAAVFAALVLAVLWAAFGDHAPAAQGTAPWPSNAPGGGMGPVVPGLAVAAGDVVYVLLEEPATGAPVLGTAPMSAFVWRHP